MTEVGPTTPRPAPRPEAPTPGVSPQAPGATTPPGTSPAMERANRMSASNMLRSLLPLVVICLLIVGWQAFRTDAGDPVRVVDPTSTVRLAAERADYPVPAPAGLPEDYRPTSARTNAGNAAEGDTVTLEIGYVTPSEEFAGFTVSDDLGAPPVRAVLEGATEEREVEIAGQAWTRAVTDRGETALTREADGVVVVVSGSAPDDELRAVAAAVEPAES